MSYRAADSYLLWNICRNTASFYRIAINTFLQSYLTWVYAKFLKRFEAMYNLNDIRNILILSASLLSDVIIVGAILLHRYNGLCHCQWKLLTPIKTILLSKEQREMIFQNPCKFDLQLWLFAYVQNWPYWSREIIKRSGRWEHWTVMGDMTSVTSCRTDFFLKYMMNIKKNKYSHLRCLHRFVLTT